jgi:hypothetical protein
MTNLGNVAVIQLPTVPRTDMGINIKDYQEYIVTFSNEDHFVTLEGLTEDGFWIELNNWTVDVSPEDFAYGVYEALLSFGLHADFENLDVDYAT